MRKETVQTDITVVGGGLAGVCAAIAAARMGQTVSLIQNRPVLGGNSSSEVRVWVCGATAHGVHRYARETGIMGELFVENQYMNPEGNPYYWDLAILEKVKAEKNIQLFLNTDVREVDSEGKEDNRKITAVTGWMMGSERHIRFESNVFLDCTGDGLVGFLAGAKYRIGREAKSEFNEDWAPEEADDITLGSSILFYTKDIGYPVKYVPPSFAKDITKTSIPLKRVIRSGDNGCAYWWIEWGGEVDTVYDNEKIRDELWSAIYGVWDYIKNSGKFDADHLTLEWIGALPGKREYRRFIGDYIINQNDILNQRRYEDDVAFGGWSIDLHPPQGMYAEEGGAKHLHMDGVYHIPFRSLYSQNVSNLLFAGRNISASHVAFGTTRVMATCAVIGEAAGTGAALSFQKGTSPRGLYENHLKELQQVLLKQDASLIGISNTDENDLAQKAILRSSSERKQLIVADSSQTYALTADVGLHIPIEPTLDQIELLLDAEADTILEVELWDTGKMENYIPAVKQLSERVSIEKGAHQWVSVNLPWHPADAQNAFIIIKENKDIRLHVSNQSTTGILAYLKDKNNEKESHQLPKQEVTRWNMSPFVRKAFCIKVYPETNAFSAGKLIDGYNRPYGGPHMWVSGEMTDGTEEWAELGWNQPITIKEVQVIFNDDVNEDLINLHHHKTPFDIIPELVKDYRLEIKRDGKRVVIHEEKGNRKRKQHHLFSNDIESNTLRIVVENTNGASSAEIVAIRVY
ncbi:FAD-dependent oxidoreductase [Bacillus sp. FSL K6-3431]|uniref:FAD-dependent oxidoreductase n=1 Tax=Bacillus sp. FSL K6-3431 TaxID=2921500 RepID=UPI0030F89767